VKKPLVVKLGSSLVVGPRGRPRRSLLRDRAAVIAELVHGARHRRWTAAMFLIFEPAAP